MTLFKDMLKDNESLFKNDVALDFDFLPKLLPYREKEQHYLAQCIAPLLQGRNGRNLFIHGISGIGKTAALKFVVRELEEETEDVVPIFINCWQKNTSYKIVMEICNIIGYSMTHNKKSDELFNIVKQILNKKSAVFIFDEVDKVDDFDFLYTILEEIYKKSIFLITNHRDWLLELDPRVKSRLMPESFEFKKYNAVETKGILKQRLEYGFVDGVWDMDSFDLVAKKSFELEDIRSGLYLLRESGLSAEAKASRNITAEHVKDALSRLDEFSIKNKSELDAEIKFILNIVKQNSGKKIGDLFKIYEKEGGKTVYKTFQRKIRKLADGKFVTIEKIMGGAEGTTSLISVRNVKKLTEF